MPCCAEGTLLALCMSALLSSSSRATSTWPLQADTIRAVQPSCTRGRYGGYVCMCTSADHVPSCPSPRHTGTPAPLNIRSKGRRNIYAFCNITLDHDAWPRRQKPLYGNRSSSLRHLSAYGHTQLEVPPGDRPGNPDPISRQTTRW
jgi:hypothetical protein